MTRIGSAAKGKHRVFHSISSISYHYFWVFIFSKGIAVECNDTCCVFCCFLPFSSITFHGECDAFNSAPCVLTHPVSWVSCPCEIMHVIGMKVPCFGFFG